MFILPGVIGLLIFIFGRPFEFVESLRHIPFLYVFFGLGVFGYAVDLRLRTSQARWTPQLPWVMLFAAWCVIATVVKAPSGLVTGGLSLTVMLAVYFVMAHGIQTFRALEALMAVVLACSLWISAVCIHEGLQPYSCVALRGEDFTQRSTLGQSDGRPCTDVAQCYQGSPDPELHYRCERAGAFGVTSIGGGRVRYVGVLQDPNEVALAVSASVPLALAFYMRKRSKARALLVALTVAFVGACVVFTQSRGGMLVFLAVLATYFLKRYRWKGALAGLVLAAPVLLLGGREGAEASTSTTERLDAWFAGLQMFRMAPALGVGFDQFTEHHFLTAHNSFILALAELGFAGLVLWTAALYVSIKIPWVALRTVPEPEAQVARIWALAMLASMIGMTVGIFFLSFTYHYVLWVYLGLAGALYTCIKTHAPDWKVPFGWKDLAGLVIVNTGLVAALYLYTRFKLASS